MKEALEDVHAGLRKLFHTPLDPSEQEKIDKALHGLDRMILVVEKALKRPEVAQPPLTRPTPYTIRIEPGAWVSANDVALTCLVGMTLTCKIQRSTMDMWECRAELKDQKEPFCRAFGATRDRAIHNMVHLIRDALIDSDRSDHEKMKTYFDLR